MNISIEAPGITSRSPLLRWRPAVYWLATAAVVAELAVGGIWDITRMAAASMCLINGRRIGNVFTREQKQQMAQEPASEHHHWCRISRPPVTADVRVCALGAHRGPAVP